MTVTLIPGKPVLSLGSFDLSTLNYVVQEYSFSGEAVSYQAVGAQGVDGTSRGAAQRRDPGGVRVDRRFRRAELGVSRQSPASDR